MPSISNHRSEDKTVRRSSSSASGHGSSSTIRTHGATKRTSQLPAIEESTKSSHRTDDGFHSRAIVRREGSLANAMDSLTLKRSSTQRSATQDLALERTGSHRTSAAVPSSSRSNHGYGTERSSRDDEHSTRGLSSTHGHRSTHDDRTTRGSSSTHNHPSTRDDHTTRGHSSTYDHRSTHGDRSTHRSSTHGGSSSHHTSSSHRDRDTTRGYTHHSSTRDDDSTIRPYQRSTRPHSKIPYSEKANRYETTDTDFDTYRSSRLVTISSDDDDGDIYGDLKTQYDMLTTYSTRPSRSSGKDIRHEVGLIEAKIANYSQGYLDGLGDARTSSRRSHRSHAQTDNRMLRGLDLETMERYALNWCERFNVPGPYSLNDVECFASLWACQIIIDKCRDMYD
ncbi:MAG: hypothetical protein LQ337_004034 [Flavoplaca oasis]|nr:MAG: hypothetical protein LQ337_004034 [Flavoplaca oasis]